MKVDSIWGPRQYVWGIGTGEIPLMRPSCYYLGSYANLWDPTHRQIIPAHMLGSVKVETILGPGTIPMPGVHEIVATGVHSMGTKPGIGGVVLPDTHIEQFDAILEKYTRQELESFAWADTLTDQQKAERGEAWNATMEAIKDDLSDLSFFYKDADIRGYFLQNFQLFDRVKRYKDCVAKHFPPKEKPPPPPPPKPKAPPGWPGPTSEPPQPETGSTPEKLTLTINFGPDPDYSIGILLLYTWLELPTA